MGRRYNSPENFWANVNKTNSCWLWKGYVKPGGYGYVTVVYESEGAHRYAWRTINGAIPLGKHLHHKCGNKLCVRPDHLELVSPSRHPGGGAEASRNKTHCPKGHEYSDSNTGLQRKPDGSEARYCRKCRRSSWRAWKRKKARDAAVTYEVFLAQEEEFQ